jgi:hypothetical protein
MKTTLDLADELVARAKRVALERDITLRALVEEALERAIGSSRARWEPLATVTYGDPGRAESLLSGTALLREANPDTDSPDYIAKRLGLRG